MQVPSLSRNQHRLQAPSTNRSLSGDFKLWMPDGAGLVRVPRRAPQDSASSRPLHGISLVR